MITCLRLSNHFLLYFQLIQFKQEMPPKPVGKKGENEDFSDVVSLPQANVFKFTLVHKSFFDQETRDKVKKVIADKLYPTSYDRIKPLTREEILTFAKGKGIQIDGEAREEGMARATTDKIFEMTVSFRRQRKDRMAAAEEGSFDQDLVDGFIYLIDYPTTKSEILALSKYNQGLNAVLEIEEIPKPIEEVESGSEEEEVEEAVVEEAPKTQTDSVEARQQAMDVFNAFKNARHESDPKSVLRQLAFLRVSYVNAPHTFQTSDDHGIVTEKNRSAEDSFISELVGQYIDKYAQYHIQYLKFKRLVTVEPLMPDQAALRKIKEIKAETKKNNGWLQEAHAELEMQIKELEDSKADARSKGELDATDKEIENTRQRFSNLKQEKETRASVANKELNDLMKRTHISLDDERDYTKFKMSTYNSDFVANPEIANSIGSVLSAMVTQIETDHASLFVNQRSPRGDITERSDANMASTADASMLDDIFERYHSEISCDLKLMSRGEDPLEIEPHVETMTERVSTTSIEIQDEMDATLTAKQTMPHGSLDSEQARLDRIQTRERSAYNNLNLPGKNRHLMPPLPSQSKRQRDAENPAFYPFCTLPHEEAERMLVLKHFQQLIRSNLIDHGQSLMARHSKFKVFERTFQNHMSPEIFRQVFATALLDEPDMASLYYPRSDSLLVALFNKGNRSNPNSQSKKDLRIKPVRQLDLSINSQDIDGERRWRAAYKVLPDFENWLAYFADEIVLESESPVIYQKPVDPTPPPVAAKGGLPPAEVHDPNLVPVTFMKYSVDEETLPESMLKVEDNKIQSISEKSAFLYPDDNSVMRVDHFTVGGRQFSKSFVQKDNLRFGLRQRSAAVVEKETEFGLVRQTAVGDSEFWLHFENGTKMGIEQIQIERNPQTMVKIEPKAPTPEEIAFKLEQMKKLAEATAKAAKANKPPPTDIQIPETPKATWETGPLNYLDKLFPDEVIGTSTARATLTMKNGLIVYYLGSGHVCQFNQNLEHSNEESDRIVTREGVVIRQMANKDAEMLFPDGVHAHFSRKHMTWTITNNKGMVRNFKDGIFTDMPAIPAAAETDAVTGARMLIREDEVVTVTYKDGSVFCQHRDGTQIHTSANGSEIRIEKQGLASHTIKIGNEQNVEKGDAYGRAMDGRVIETYLPDGSMSCSFLDVVNTKNNGDIECFRHMLYRSDLSVVHFDSMGHISIITSNARSALNELGEKKKMNSPFKDSDYLIDLKREHGYFTPQVYQAHIHARDGKSNIKTKNTLNNTKFVLKQDLTLCKISDQIPVHVNERTVSLTKAQKKRQFAKVMIEASDLAQANKQSNSDLQIEPTGSYKEPNNRYFDLPRLFVVSADGSAKEFMCAEQLEYNMRKKAVRQDLTISNRLGQVINNSHIESTYYLTKVVNTAQIQKEQTKLGSLEFPKNAEEVLRQKTQTSVGKSDAGTAQLHLPVDQVYIFQQIFNMSECDTLKQTSFADDYQRFLEWKMSQVRYDTEFGIVHVPASKDGVIDWNQIEDDEFMSKRINAKILKIRSQPMQAFNGENLRDNALEQMHSSGSIDKMRAIQQQSKAASKKRTPQEAKLDKHYSEKHLELKKQKQSKEALERDEKRLKKQQKLEELQAMADFMPEYFGTESGFDFLSKFPQKAPTQEMLTRMQQRLERKNNESQAKLGNGNAIAHDDEHDGHLEERDNPIVALEPDELKQGSHFTGSKRMEKSSILEDGQTQLDPANLPSLYMQEKLYLFQKEQEQLLKAEEHHIVKTKDFNVIGRLREEKPFVKTIQRSTASCELNEKFITTEVITDRRVKISSMAPRFYVNAPSVEDVRKQGQHQMILSAINKKQTFGELINQANSMVTGVLHDSLKRSLNVMPGSVTFGAVRTGSFNEILLTLKNEDSMAHRITIKPVGDNRIIVKQLEYGIIAPGMIRTISVGIRIAGDESNVPSSIKDTIEIVSKHDIFKIPVTARIISAADFDEENRNQMQTTGNPIQNSRVRERLLRKIEESKQDGPVVLTKMPRTDEMEEDDFENSNGL